MNQIGLYAQVLMNYYCVKITKNFMILQFELNVFVDINNKEKISEWFKTFELKSKTIMLEMHQEIF